MGNVVAELTRVHSAYAQPTLGLLHADTAPVVVAILRACFDDTTTAVDAVWLEQAVDNHLATLRGTGADKVPAGSGRDLCRQWMNKQWLVRSLDADREVYTLTSHAQGALGLVRSISSDRAGLSEHRVATIMSAARRFNAGANPDVGERIRIIDSEIARLEEDKRRLADGEDIPEVTDDYLLQGYSELYDLVASLPRDFARVQESYTRMRSDLMASFRSETTAPGQLVAEYIDKVNGLMTATAEGRAFEGALALLRNEDHKDQLRADLRDLVSHPQVRNILTPAELAQLRSTMDVINDGTQSVLRQRQRVSTALRDYLNSHDALEERELERVLRSLDAQFHDWLERTGPRTTSTISLPERPDLESLPTKFWDPLGQAEPDPLELTEPDPHSAPTLEDLAAGGGPSLAELRAAVHAAAGTSDHLADVFNHLGLSLRRPVEITGLLHLATNDPDLHVSDELDVYKAVRPDGSTRHLLGPRVTIATEESP